MRVGLLRDGSQRAATLACGQPVGITVGSATRRAPPVCESKGLRFMMVSMVHILVPSYNPSLRYRRFPSEGHIHGVTRDHQ